MSTERGDSSQVWQLHSLLYHLCQAGKQMKQPSILLYCASVEPMECPDSKELKHHKGKEK